MDNIIDQCEDIYKIQKDYNYNNRKNSKIKCNILVRREWTWKVLYYAMNDVLEY